MPDEYAMLSIEETGFEPSAKSGTPVIDLGAALGCTEMRPKVWTIEPGNDRKTYHRHAVQEEFYLVLEGPGRMRVAGETVTVPVHGAVRVPPETPRKVVNDTDDPHVWLVIGAPDVDDPGQAVDEP